MNLHQGPYALDHRVQTCARVRAWWLTEQAMQRTGSQATRRGRAPTTAPIDRQALSHAGLSCQRWVNAASCPAAQPASSSLISVCSGSQPVFRRPAMAGPLSGLQQSKRGRTSGLSRVAAVLRPGFRRQNLATSRHSRETWLTPQFAFELVQEAEVSALANKLVRGRAAEGARLAGASRGSAAAVGTGRFLLR